NELIISQKKSSKMTWASNASTDTSLTNMSQSQAKTDFNGKSNTAVIVAAYPSDTSSNNAAIYCNEYSTAGTSAGDWYLPAAGELYSYVYSNYSTINPIATTLSWDYFDGYYFWSSSEGNVFFAWRVQPISGILDDDNFKNNHSSSVSCFLAIN
ncbi:MAG: hypothetical protein IJX20_01325, partial [Alphaproteobacteria bacterium]|nr:hypothetical protein [Alphaproteobacteria bacterium]